MKRIFIECGDSRILHVVREDADYFVCGYGDSGWRLGRSNDGEDGETVALFTGPTAEEDARDALRAIGKLLGMEEET